MVCVYSGGKLSNHVVLIFFFKDFIYSLIETQLEREREAEIQAEGKAGTTQGAQRGTRSRVSRIKPRAAGSALNRCATRAALQYHNSALRRQDSQLDLATAPLHRGESEHRGRDGLRQG